MLKHWRKLLVLSMVCSVAPVSAERLVDPASPGSGCPYERARLAAADRADMTVSPAEGVPSGSVFAHARSSFLAP